MPRAFSPSRCLRQPARAFTLIELMVVIAIIAIAMTFVVVNLGGMTPVTRLTSAGRYVAAMIAQARDEAVISGHSIGIGYDLSEHTVWLDVPTLLADAEEEDSQGEPGERVRMKLQHLHEDLEIRAVEMPGRQVSSGQVVLDFSPLGAATPHIIQIHSRRIQEDVWLQVNPLTGQVRMVYSGDESSPEKPRFEEVSDASFAR